jgi:hypothetical protein
VKHLTSISAHCPVKGSVTIHDDETELGIIFQQLLERLSQDEVQSAVEWQDLWFLEIGGKQRRIQ